MATVTNKSLSLVDLPEYINQNSMDLIGKTLLDTAPSTKEFVLQTGVTAKTAINLLDTTVTFGDGSTCGFSQNSTNTISQRYLNPGFIKVNAEWCDKDLLKTFASHEVRMSALHQDMPFKEKFANDIVKVNAAELEKLIWQGDTTLVSGNMKYADGLLTILKADCPAANKINGSSETSIFERVWNLYKAVKAEVKFDVVIYMGRENFTLLIKELLDKNFFHINEKEDRSQEITLPGTNTKVKAMPGLDDTDYIVAMDPAKVVYGVDMESDSDEYKMVYFEREETFGLKLSYAVSVQVARPDEVWYSYGSGSQS